MKVLARPLSRNYLPLRLFRDDLEKIEEILKRGAQGYSIRASGMEYDSIAEVAQHLGDGVISEAAISARQPYISIELMRTQARLYVSSDNNADIGLYHQIDEVLCRTRRKLWPLYSLYSTWSLNAALLVAALVLTRTMSLIVAGIVISWVIWVGYVRLRCHAWLCLRSRRTPGFWARRKEDVILAVVSAAIGAILGTAGTLLAQHLGQ